MKRVTWNRTVRQWTLTLGLTTAFGSNVYFGLPVSSVAEAAEATGAASVEEALKVLDLQKIGLPAGSTLNEGSQLNLVNYETKAAHKDAFKFQQQQLLKRGFKEEAGTQSEASFTSGTFSKNGFAVSVMSYADTGNREGATRVILNHLGNVPAVQIPVMKDAKLVVSGIGNAAYGTNVKTEEAIKQTRAVLTKAGWEPYGVNPIPPAGEVQIYKQGAIRLIAFVAPPPPGTDLQGAVAINYSLQLLTADIPAPTDAQQVMFSDYTKELQFESAAEFAAIAKFYQERLAQRGFKPTTDELVESPNAFGQTVVLQEFRNKANEMLAVELQRQEGKTAAKVIFLTASEVAAREKTQRESAARLVAERLAREQEEKRTASKNSKHTKAKTSDVDVADLAIPDVDATVNAALADALKGTGIDIKIGDAPTVPTTGKMKTKTKAESKSKPGVDQAKLDFAKKLQSQFKDDDDDAPKAKSSTTKTVAKKPLSSIEPQQNVGKIVFDDETAPLTHAIAFAMTRDGQRLTRVVLSGKPAKQAAVIEYISMGDADRSLSFPEPHVIVDLDEHDQPYSLQLQLGSKSLGGSGSDLTGEAVVTDGHARGSFRMTKDRSFFRSKYRVELSFDIDLLTKDSKPSLQLADAPRLESTGKVVAGNKTYKLGSVVAYETQSSDGKRTHVFMTEKPIKLDKLKAALKETGSDSGFFELQPQVKVEIENNTDKVAMYNFWADGASISSNSNLVSEVVVEGGRARGSVKLAKPENVGRDNYSFEMTFDVDVLTLAE